MRSVIFLGLVFIGSQIGKSNGVEISETTATFFSCFLAVAIVMDIGEFFDNLKR